MAKTVWIEEFDVSPDASLIAYKSAEAGTYDVTGNVVTLRPLAAKNPGAMAPGAYSTWSFTVEGNTLRATAQQNQHGPVANPPTITLLRVE